MTAQAKKNLVPKLDHESGRAKKTGESIDAVRTPSEEAWSVFLREFKRWCVSKEHDYFSLKEYKMPYLSPQAELTPQILEACPIWAGSVSSYQNTIRSGAYGLTFGDTLTFARLPSCHRNSKSTKYPCSLSTVSTFET